MPSEVVAAWIDASKHFVNLLELQDKVGEAIAKLVGVEAALVTTGAAGALLLGTAAAVAGADAKQIRRLPDTTGMKNEVILQKAHHTCYENQLTDVGTKLVEVETSAEVLIVFKTTAARYPELETRIRKLHGYEVPEIVAFPLANGLPEYLKWVEASCGESR